MITRGRLDTPSETPHGHALQYHQGSTYGLFLTLVIHMAPHPRRQIVLRLEHQPNSTSLQVGITFTKWYLVLLAQFLTTSTHLSQRDTGNIIPLDKGHMRLSPQARKA